jgi:hypothetical protein
MKMHTPPFPAGFEPAFLSPWVTWKNSITRCNSINTQGVERGGKTRLVFEEYRVCVDKKPGGLVSL